MKRKWTTWVYALVAATGVFAGAGKAQAQVILNGQNVHYAAPPFVIGEFLMVPLSETLTALGATPPVWEVGRRRATFTFGGNNVVIRAESGYALVNGRGVVMGVPAVLRDSELFVPLSFFRRQFGVTVDVEPGFVREDVRAQVLGFRSAEFGNPGAVGIGGVNLLVLRTESGYPSLRARAERVTEQLSFGLSRALTLDDGKFNTSRITVDTMAGQPTIFIAGIPLVMVTAEDAAANKTTQAQLAQKWLGDIREAMRQIYR